MTQVKSKIEERIDELEQYLKELDEAFEDCRKHPNQLQLSPIAGILERNELASLKKIWENCEHD